MKPRCKGCNQYDCICEVHVTIDGHRLAYLNADPVPINPVYMGLEGYMEITENKGEN